MPPTVAVRRHHDEACGGHPEAPAPGALPAARGPVAALKAHHLAQWAGACGKRDHLLAFLRSLQPDAAAQGGGGGGPSPADDGDRDGCGCDGNGVGSDAGSSRSSSADHSGCRHRRGGGEAAAGSGGCGCCSGGGDSPLSLSPSDSASCRRAAPPAAAAALQPAEHLPQLPPPPPRGVFVGGLPQSAREAELVALFSRCGPVARAWVARDRHTARGLGYGYILFSGAGASEACARAAALDGEKLAGGRQVRVLLSGRDFGCAVAGAGAAGRPRRAA